MGDPGEKTVKIVPSAVVRAEGFDHEIVDHGVKQHRDRGKQRILQGDDMVCDEETKRNDRKHRAQTVQKKAGARENQHKALDRGQDKQ